MKSVQFAMKLSLACLLLAGATAAPAQERLQSADLLKMRSVGDVELSPDRSHIAYSVSNNDGTGRPYSQLWIMDAASGKTARVGDDASRGSDPVWSRDGSQLAFMGKLHDQSGILLCRADGSELQFL